ncbi:MAG: hypothetical protein Q8N39_10425 [Pelolinea sp.]|nr:hypothetical protein [Pelolinea sp.]
MSVDLFNDRGGYFGTSNWGWALFIILADMYGWVSLGTQPPKWHDPGKPWNKEDYCSNNGQIVTAQDAQGIAAAIESAIQNLSPAPDFQPLEERKPYGSALSERLDMLLRAAQAEKPDTVILGFDLEYKAPLQELVDFCRQGEFKIC